MVRAGLRFTLLTLFAAGVAGSASAQVSPLDIFGGLMGAAQAQAAREAWARLPGADRSCLQRALAPRNSDIESLARSGIGPDDGRLSPYVTQCRRFTEATLRRGVSCSVRDDASGSVGTTCDQSFAYRDNAGRVRPVDVREAVELHFSGTRVFVTEVETEEARLARAARVEAQGRAEQLQVLRATLASYQRQPSPVVRAEVARLQNRIEQQLAARTGPTAPDAEAIERAVQALDALSDAEARRLAALDRLNGLRAQAEARTKGDIPDGLKRRLAELRTATAAVSEPPRTVPIQKAVLASDRELGPSFDCEKATTPLPLMICEDTGLRRLDLELARPFYALRHLRPDDGVALKAESNDLVKRTLETCRVPDTGKVNGALRARAVPCIAATYQRQREAWAARVAREGPTGARQELTRPISEHVRLQEALRSAGVLAGDAPADGVYGSVTRRAITSFADAQGLPADGFLSNAFADRLGQRSGDTLSVSVSVDPGLVTRIDAVANRYEGYLTDLGSEERERSSRVQAQARLDEQRKRVRGLLGGPVPDDLRRDLAETLRQAEERGPADARTADGIEQRMVQLEPRLRDLETMQRVITDRNRFLIEDDANDIVLLYNSSPKATGVARGLDGGLVFDPERMVACALTDPPTDRIAQEQLAAKARAVGAPVKDAFARCTAAQQQSADLVVFERGALRAQSGLFGTVASAVDTGVYALAGMLPKADLDAVRQSEGIRAAEAEAEVARGTSDGLAVLALANGSRTLCRVAGGEPALHDRLLKPYEVLLRGELRGPVTAVTSSADGAFLSAKRGQCGAIYASAREMAALSKASTRDGVVFRYLPIWITPEAVEKARQELVDRNEEGRRAQAERDRERGEEQVRRDRQAVIERLNRSKAEAEAALKAGVPPDLQGFLTGFVTDVASVGPDTAPTRLQELGDRYAERRGRIDEAARLAHALTPKSRFLIEGERGDLIVLYNDGGKAPSVVRNLRGELVFEDGRAVACLYHAPLGDVFLNRQIRDRSAALGARLDLPLAACASGTLADQDLIFAERDRLLREPVDRVIALAGAVNGGLYTRLTVVDASALAAVKQAEAAKANEVEAMVRGRRGEGVGVIVAANASSVVCRVGDANAEAQDAILARLAERLGDELPSRPITSPTSADGAFIGVKRGECGAVYAATADLLSLVEAMGRDGLGFRFLPIWIVPEEVVRTQTGIDQGKRQKFKDQAERERELRDRDAVERDKAAEEARKREAMERVLRAQWGERARFFEQSLGEEAKAFADGRPSTFGDRYPNLARAYAGLRDDRWEYMSAQTTILDYGTAMYKERSLETALATSIIKMRNRIRGEYRDVCVVTGYVNDAEFGVVRDMIGEPCDGSGPKLAQYKQGERFVSRWKAP
ncbi:peptidoglycan-binding protein [Methylobacterium sp. WL116]|uniref:peptidoglycan-binding protein n=1 Tax=Methylobacterium sp. WL116 TaxID=2603889 RepID=UPI0016508B3C|nr:peptidoglycan-binding protein [Methylobacterium sp. WL116]